MGSHFDETTRIPMEFYHSNSLHFTFTVGWYGHFVGKEADRVYVLYRGTMTAMELTFGSNSNGVYESHFEDPLHCEPYGFVVITTDDEVYRLPEDERYYFGTQWVELESGVPRKPGVDYADCNENHYFLDHRKNDQWIANGADNITKNEITYVDHQKCSGCAAVPLLVRVYDEFMRSRTVIDCLNDSTTNSHSVALPTAAPSEFIGICNSSGLAGYEVIESFKMRIKTEEDEIAKIEKTASITAEVIGENAECSDYNISVQEQWVRTKRIEVTIIICFHCAEPNAAFTDTEERTSAHTNVITAVLAAVIVAVVCLWLICCIGLWLKWKLKRKEFEDNPDLLPRGSPQIIDWQ